MSCKRQWGIEKISSHAIAQHFIVEAFCFDSCLQRVYLSYFPGYSSHQSSLCFRHSPDLACLYFSSEMIWWEVRPPVYSGALIISLLYAPHIAGLMFSWCQSRRPQTMSLSLAHCPGYVRLCRRYLRSHALHCCPGPGYIWSSLNTDFEWDLATGSIHSTDSKKVKCYLF